MASTSWTIARTRSAPIMTARRGSRSAQTPPTSRNTTLGGENAVMTSPRSVPDPLTSSTANASATNDSESPTTDAVRPIHRFRKFRSRSGPESSRIASLDFVSFDVKSLDVE